MQRQQVCYNSADALPVRRPLLGGWQLVDEGGLKGVAKLGYLSRALGETRRARERFKMVVASDFDLNRDETNSIAREDGAGTRARGLTKTFHERLRAGLQNAGKTSFIDALSGENANALFSLKRDARLRERRLGPTAPALRASGVRLSASD